MRKNQNEHIKLKISMKLDAKCSFRDNLKKEFGI